MNNSTNFKDESFLLINLNTTYLTIDFCARHFCKLIRGKNLEEITELEPSNQSRALFCAKIQNLVGEHVIQNY